MCPPCFLTTSFTANVQGGHIGPPLHYYIFSFRHFHNLHHLREACIIPPTLVVVACSHIQ